MPLRLDFALAVANIKAHYYAAVQYPTLYQAGVRWYFTARVLLQAMAVRTGVHLDVATAVTAVLSPKNKWTRNVVDAENCLKAAANGESETSIKCSTYPANRAKAFRIIGKEFYGDVLSGNKVTSFFWNMRHPDDDYTVTVDGHALAVALGARISISKLPSLSDKQYNLVGDAYRQACKEINLDQLTGAELVPSQVQAVCWIYYRFLHNIG